MSLIDDLTDGDTELLELEELWRRIQSVGKGAPALSDDAHAAYCAWNNITPGRSTCLAGTGELAGLTLRKRTQFMLLAKDLGVGVASPVPPETPESQPEEHYQEICAKAGVEDPPTADAGKRAAADLKPDGLESGARDVAAVENALKTLRARKCGMKERHAAVEVLCDALSPRNIGDRTFFDRMAETGRHAGANAVVAYKDTLCAWLRSFGENMTAEAVRAGAPEDFDGE